MKGNGTILMPVYHQMDVTCNEIQYYVSEIRIELGGKVWECSYNTNLKTFKDINKNGKKGDGYIAYTKWLESYLKRSVGNLMVNDGVNFTYA